MNDKESQSSVIAGIDGSQTAISAAQWAIDEAVGRGVPLRLVYATKATHPSADAYDEEVHHAKVSLRAAQSAIEATGKPVKVETAIVTGPPGPALVAESRDADMVCVGSVGIGRYARSILGSTATELAETAHCPVAVIRPQENETRPDISWIVVAVDEQPNTEALVEYAMEEAKLRQAQDLLLATGSPVPRHCATDSNTRWTSGKGAIPKCTSTRSRTEPTSLTSSRNMMSQSSSP